MIMVETPGAPFEGSWRPVVSRLTLDRKANEKGRHREGA
jgi:hypothetical protein